jgi:uncharacterized protein YxjI
MAKKTTKKGTKNSKKQLTLQETIGELIRQVEDDLETVREQWNRYNEGGIKKGFKEARKAVLLVKKGAMEIRKSMSLIEL